MSRIKEIFKKEKNNVLSIYCTIGYPHLQSTLEVMKALQQNGADIIELGMPYSDPLADGPVIQHSSGIAARARRPSAARRTGCERLRARKSILVGALRARDL